ncbi:MAG: SDR family oxidoreductase [Hyphomicrobiaceae bacterium]
MASAKTSSRGVLVTGGAKRIGRSIALALAARGWAVALHYRSSRAEAEDTARIIAANGGIATLVQGDLSDLASYPTMIETCRQELGTLTALINNASEFEFDTITTMTESDWARHMDVNLRAPVFLSQAFAAAIPAAEVGSIINIVDQRAWRLTPEFFSYTLSKVALWDATRMLAQALAPKVRVNAVGPGPVLRSVHQTAAEFEAEAASTLLKRPTSPDEIAQAVAFILDAPAMTGQMIALDSGQHLAWDAAIGRPT